MIVRSPTPFGLLLIGAVALLGGGACKGSGKGLAGGGPAGSVRSVPSAPPPLDTSWQRDPGRLLAPGDSAPDFEGIAHTGMRVRLSALLERPVVVYFYASDGTPAAEDAAREFRDAWLKMTDRIAMVIGVSADDRISHRDFATALELPFLLVADESLKIARAFGVPLDGGRARPVTFLVGKDRKVLRVLTDVAPGSRVSELLAAVPAP